MTIVDLSEFADYCRNQVVADDTLLQLALDAAEAAVQQECHRVFAVVAADATATARVFRPPVGSRVLWIDDARSVTAVNDGTARSGSDYQLEPLNGINLAGEAVPYTAIRPLTYCWSAPSYVGQASVSVTARWGWSAIPSAVKQATMVMAKDLLQQRDTRGGIVGMDSWNVAVRLRENPVVTKLLAPYRRVDRIGMA